MDDKNTRIELSTELVPILNLGMYESLLDPRYMFEESMDDLLNTNEEETDFDFPTYSEDVGKIAGVIIKRELEDLLKKYGVEEVEFIRIDSPKFYNNATDEGAFDLIVDEIFDTRLRAQIDEWRGKEGWEDGANKIIKDAWGSRDGFWSWMPQSVQEIYELDDYERCVAAFITLLMIDQEIIKHSMRCGFNNECLQEEFYYECAGSLSYRNYATIESIFPEELYEAYLKKPDLIDEMIWRMYDLKILKYNDFPPRNRSDNAISFLEWCKERDYTTLEELEELINTTAV